MSLCAKENPNKHINMINMRSISDRGYRTVSGRYTQSEGQAHKSVCLVLIADFRFIGNENGDMPQRNATHYKLVCRRSGISVAISPVGMQRWNTHNYWDNPHIHFQTALHETGTVLLVFSLQFTKNYICLLAPHIVNQFAAFVFVCCCCIYRDICGLLAIVVVALLVKQ